MLHKSFDLPVFLVTIAIVGGCQQPEPEQAPNPAEAKAEVEVEAKTEAKADKPGTKPADAPNPDIAKGDINAVESCASYVKLYRACIDEKLSTSDKGPHKIALESQIATWEKALGDPAKTEVVAGECKAATTGAKTAMVGFGCTWP